MRNIPTGKKPVKKIPRLQPDAPAATPPAAPFDPAAFIRQYVDDLEARKISGSLYHAAEMIKFLATSEAQRRRLDELDSPRPKRAERHRQRTLLIDAFERFNVVGSLVNGLIEDAGCSIHWTDCVAVEQFGALFDFTERQFLSLINTFIGSCATLEACDIETALVGDRNADH